MITGGVWVFVCLAVALLVYLNLPQIRTINGPILREYTAAFLKGLPEGKAILLSDDLRRPLLLRSALTLEKTKRDYVFLNTASLKWPDYHRFLKKLHPQLWPLDPPKGRREQLDDAAMFHLVSFLAQTNSLYYLHPTFGYYLERFYLEPHGTVYKMASYPTNALLAPPLSQSLIAENEAFWADSDISLARLMNAVTPRQAQKRPAAIQYVFDKVHIQPEPSRDALLLAGFYSHTLDYWGVEMQKLGKLSEAEGHFKKALALNPDNIVAQLNLQCNHNLSAGRKAAVQVPKSLEDAFGKYRSWDQVMGQNGPFDEPTFCFEQGRLFASSRLYHQAGQQFFRVRQLAPGHLGATFWLSQVYLVSSMPDQALALLEEVQTQPQLFSIHRTNHAELLFLEISAYLAKNDVTAAERTVHNALEKYPNDEESLLTASQVFLQNKHFSNGLPFIDMELKLSPDNVNMLVNKGFAHLQLKQYDLAIPPLDRALSLQSTNHLALLNRAIAQLGAGRLDQAQADYESLQKAYPTAFQVYFGLQEIAYKKGDTNSAVRYCELYLTNSPPGNPEAAMVIARLKELRPGSP
jgi:tetratricopeptide (TPR) repeat protein